MRFDVFLSHASEDKAAFVEPLYQALTERGLKVWYDRTHILWGDDFRQKMADGLRQSQYGIVVLSPRFPKYWPQQEVSVLHTLESTLGASRILPIVLDMTWDEVVVEHPFMGVRNCAFATDGIEALADRAYQRIKGLSPATTPTSTDSGTDSDARPAPTFLSERHRSLNERLKELRREKALASPGRDTAVLDRQMVAIKRELRAEPELVSGDWLSDSYELLEIIGSGGFATVWRAYDEVRVKPVAIKVLHPRHTRSVERVERFFRGSRLMQSLQHPHIVEVLEQQGEDEGHRYFVMELLAGGDLWRAIQKKALTPVEILDVVEAIAAALALAHQHGAIHRDVKPENILMTRVGVPKLTDFDLVRAADTTGGTRTGALGTFIYAAPEAMEDASRADPSVDVYGLAMTAVVGLSGRRPGLEKKLQPDLLIHGLDIPARLSALLKSALQVKAEERPRDAALFLERFRASRRVVSTTTRSRRRPQDPPPPLRVLPAQFSERPGWTEGRDDIGVYADVTIPDSKANFRMRLIPAGTFQMGSPETERGRHDREGPQHTVTLTQDFWVADAPCTQAVYEAVVGKNPSRFKGADRPVENVSWDDVQAFLQALHKRMPRLAMALPSEAQWEYACRAGTTDARYGEVDAIAWYHDNAGGQTRLVRQKQANALGLYDMLGNVWEWCHDGMHSYDHSHAYDPIGPIHEGAGRVLRGGCWSVPARFVRAASRDDRGPSYRRSYCGFRLSRSVEASREANLSLGAPSPASAGPRGQAKIERAVRRGGRSPSGADPKPARVGATTLNLQGSQRDTPSDSQRRRLLGSGALALAGVSLAAYRLIPAALLGRDTRPLAEVAEKTGTDSYGDYADVVIPGSTAGFRMRLIEPGTFVMGSPEDEEGRFEREGPQHKVTLTEGFWLADAPCTQAVYDAVTGKNPSKFEGTDRPVEQVTWDDAQVFLQALNQKLPGLQAGLPTEAQWEYAARAGTTDARYGEVDVIAWHDGNADGQTHPVRQKQANAWGLYDMLGNVWEWCHDGARSYDHSHAYDPIGPMHEGTRRVLRGGSWNFPAQRVRAAFRGGNAPSSRHSNCGFRLSRGLGAPSKQA